MFGLTLVDTKEYEELKNKVAKYKTRLEENDEKLNIIVSFIKEVKSSKGKVDSIIDCCLKNNLEVEDLCKATKSINSANTKIKNLKSQIKKLKRNRNNRSGDFYYSKTTSKPL